jgi:hypothetical protein
MLDGLGAGALADAGERHFALAAVERRRAHLDQLVVRERAVDLRDHRVGEAFLAQLQDRVQRVGAGFERLALGWGHSSADARHQREFLRVADRFDGQIDVEVGPVEMMLLRAFDMRELGNRGVLGPRELSEGHEQLLGPQHEPEAVSRDVNNLNVQSPCARQYGCLEGATWRDVLRQGQRRQ